MNDYRGPLIVPPGLTDWGQLALGPPVPMWPGYREDATGAVKAAQRRADQWGWADRPVTPGRYAEWPNAVAERATSAAPRYVSVHQLRRSLTRGSTRRPPGEAATGALAQARSEATPKFCGVASPGRTMW